MIIIEERARNCHARKDLTGNRYGRLTAIRYATKGHWACRCDCGNEINVDTRFLNSGHTRSCGCLRKDTAKSNVVDMSGFENDGDDGVIVLARQGSDNQQVALWYCICKHCGSVFVSRGSSIRSGLIHSCGCVHSRNEQRIAQILTEHHIEFQREYTFPDLIGTGGKRLRFDFAVLYKGVLNHLIEFHGAQHYSKPHGSWGEGFEDLVKHDMMKRQYCDDNGIRLITLRYDEDYCVDDLI